MKKIIVFLLCLTVSANFLFAQDIERNVKERLTDYFNKYTATQYERIEYPPTEEILADLAKLNSQISEGLNELKNMLAGDLND